MLVVEGFILENAIADNGSKEAENQRVTNVQGSLRMGMTFGMLFWASSHKYTFSP